MLKKIAVKAGVVKDDTVYSSEGRWSDSDKIRFYNGKAQKIGGWEKTVNANFAGAARTLHSWRDFNDNRLLAIGTNSNIYILKDGVLYDITPEDGSFSTVTLNLSATGSGSQKYHPTTINTSGSVRTPNPTGSGAGNAQAHTGYGMVIAYYPQRPVENAYVDDATTPLWGTDTIYGVEEYEYRWMASPSPEKTIIESDLRTDSAIIRVYLTGNSTSIPMTGSGSSTKYYYFENIRIGDISIPKLTAPIVNSTTNYFDVKLPSTYSSGTVLNYNAFTGESGTSSVSGYFNWNGYANFSSYGVSSGYLTSFSLGGTYGIKGFYRGNIGLNQRYVYFEPPFDSSGAGIQFQYAQNTSTLYAERTYRHGSGATYLMASTTHSNPAISDAAMQNFKMGHVVTDTLAQPCARRIAVSNEFINGTNYTSSYYHSSPWWQGGLGNGVHWGMGSGRQSTQPYLVIIFEGKTYKGDAIVEQVGVPPVKWSGGDTSKSIAYTRNWFAEVTRITFYQTGNLASSVASGYYDSPYASATSNDYYYGGGWDIIGSVNIGLSRETMAIHYDNNTIPALESNGSTNVTVNAPIEAGEEHSNFAYGWGTNVWQANGWLGGTGTYSRGWGQPASTSNVVIDPRVWSFDNFGEDLVLAHNNGSPFYWDASTGVGSAAVQISNSTSPTAPQTGTSTVTHGTVPSNVKSILVTSPDRHIVCLGDGDPMKVRWASQETTNMWTENVATNTAGSQILTGGTFLVGWAKVRGQTLLFSDKNVHGMVYQGPPYTFGFKELGNNCGLISPQGAMTVQGRCYWMGFKNFFVFDGGVKVLPSPVAKYVFEDFNYAEQFKVVTGTSKGYNEIWWFYPSLSTNAETSSLNASDQNRENNRYVKYNYIENVWDIGTFSRTAWEGGTIFENDVAADANRLLYNHEVGTTDDGSPINAYVESSDFDIDDGQNIMFVDKALPDAISTDKLGGTYDETYKITFSSRKDSIGDYTAKGPFTVRTRDVIIEGTSYAKTGRINPRVRGRQMKMKVESDGLHDHWRLGDIRLDMRPDGER